MSDKRFQHGVIRVPIQQQERIRRRDEVHSL